MRLRRRAAAVGVLLLLFALGWLLWTDRTAGRLSSAELRGEPESVGALMFEGETILTVWAFGPEVAIDQIAGALGVAPGILLGELSNDRLRVWLHRARLQVVALKIAPDGRVSTRARLPRGRSLLMRGWGLVRRDPWLAGGMVRSGERVGRVHWLGGGVWSLDLEGSAGENSALGLSRTTGSAGAALQVRPALRDDPSIFRDRERGAVLLRVRNSLLEPSWGVPEPPAGTDPNGSAAMDTAFYRLEVDPSPSVALRLAPARGAASAGDQVAPALLGAPRVDEGSPSSKPLTDLLSGSVFLAGLAGGASPSALLVLEQEARPHTTQVPSAAVLSWGPGPPFWRLPGERMGDFLDLREYHMEVDEAQVRAFDRASVQAAVELEQQLADRLEASVRTWSSDDLVIVCEPSALGSWLDGYLATLDELRLLPASRRRQWRAAQRFLQALPADSIAEVGRREGIWQATLHPPRRLTAGTRQE